MKRSFFIIIGFILILGGCQHNDICTEDQPTTPKLVIQFYDAENPNVLKGVTSFNVREINSSDYYFNSPVNDTLISIPLKTNKNSTTYELVIDQEDSLNQKLDTLKFTYETNEVYINRPCGFRDEFNEFNVDSSNIATPKTWIKNIKIPHSNSITDEKNAHLYIYH